MLGLYQVSIGLRVTSVHTTPIWVLVHVYYSDLTPPLAAASGGWILRANKAISSVSLSTAWMRGASRLRYSSRYLVALNPYKGDTAADMDNLNLFTHSGFFQ